MTHRTKLLAILGLAVGFGGAGYLATPYVVRRQVEKRLPEGVRVEGRISVGFDGLLLRDVKVDKGWVHGILDEVHVSWAERIEVRGGQVQVDRTQQGGQGGQEAPRRLVTAKGLTVTLVNRRGYIRLLGTSWDGSKACFKDADFSYGFLEGHANDGCHGIDGETVREVSMILPNPPQIPGLDTGEVIVQANDVHLLRTPGDILVTAKTVDSDLVSGTNVRVRVADSDLAADLMLDATSDTLTVRHPWLDPEPQTFANIHATVLGKEVTLSSGQARVSMSFEDWSVQGQAECQAWVDAMPDTLRAGPLQTAKYTGDLDFAVSFKPKPKMTLHAKCKASCSDFQKLRQPFTYKAYRVDGTIFERTTGPGTPEWTPLGFTSQMPMAVINLEDPGFPGHRGYLTGAYQNSLVENMAKGKFFRGGSTITQQTAKNLWLKRDKTIGRKVAELFLSQGLESCMTKDQILETYLNIVEFGPNLYGIGPGARKWFNKSPGDLTPTEAFWLARILPAPRRATPPTEADMQRIEKLMATLASQGRIPDLNVDTEGLDLSEWDANP